MFNQKLAQLSNFLWLIIFAVFLICCENDKKAPKTEGAFDAEKELSAEQVTPEISDYISAFTSGEISKTSSILVQFSDEVAEGSQVGKSSTELLSFEPEIEGESVWRDRRTLEFKPDEYLQPGESYTATLQLNQIVKGVKEDLKSIQFQFKTITPYLDINLEPLKASDQLNLELLKLEGKITSSDYEQGDEIAQVLKAKNNTGSIDISWMHSADGKTHDFTIQNIRRKKKAYEISLQWNAKEMEIKFKGSKKLLVHPLQDFKCIRIEAKTNPERHILISFSDPLKKDQNLNGLIRLANQKLKFIIDGNMVKAYSATGPAVLFGDLNVIVEPGVKNVVDDKMQTRKQNKIRFNENNPEIELIGKGVITPSSSKTLFPFRAVNLSAVDVQIIKIFEKNIPYFLQVNDLPGSDELYRVGQVVIEKKIELDPDTKINIKEWNRFSLDLSEIMKFDPGSIYQIRIGFRQSYSLYGCSGSGEVRDRSPFQPLVEPDEYSSWDYWENSYDSYRRRNDPCHWAYYSTEKTVKRNILASDLGLIAKKGDYGSMMVVLTDINTTGPISGASLEVYDFQARLIKSVSTDSDGIAKIDYDRDPFLVVAKHGKQRGYLKIQDGQSNSLSRFDVAGVEAYKGIKGFIFGERGVWRPGDTLHVTFMLEDAENILPENHPVSFDLINPRGQLVERRVVTKGVNGFYVFKVKTDPDAPTGNYSGVVKVGGATFTKTLKIETIMPNRLKIKFDVNKESIVQNDGNIVGELGVTWLHGAVAKNLKTDIQVTLLKSSTRFGKFSDYVFDSPVREYFPHTKTVFDSTVDNKGLAKFPISLKANRNAPGRLKASFMCKVFEPGGAFSRDQFSIPFHPYKTYVGVKLPKGDKERGMLLTDKDHAVRIVTLNPQGKPVARKDLQVAVYKISWKWWWDNSDEDLTNYNVRSLSSAVSSGKVSTGNDGTADWKLRVNYPAWGRYLVKVTDKEGHSSGKIVYVDWPGWAGRPQAEQPGGANMLTITADKTNYLVGDKITLSIPSGSKGRALVNLESGSTVLESHWVEATKGITKFSFIAKPKMTPNIYAHVTLLQPHAQTANDLPIRMYGILPIDIENPATKLTPEISMRDVLRPEEKVEIEVSEKNGNSMTYVLAMVDEGLLDLTRFKTPDPWKHFFARIALKVQTWDNFDQIIGATGREFDMLLAVGGGEEGEMKEGESQVNRFKPVVNFAGPFKLESGDSKKHTMQMPMYVGSVRTMVIAGRDGAYGSVEKATPVKKPLMLIGTLPRVLAPTEELEFFLSVFAMEDGVKKVRISLEVDDLIELGGASTQTVEFDEPGDQLVSFPIKVNPEIGTALVKAKATSGSESAEYNFSIDIRNPNPKTTKLMVQSIEPGASWDYKPQPVGIRGTNSGVLEISSIAPMDLTKRLEYLVRYPHGCIEQTTSAAFPQLYLDKLIRLDTRTKEEVGENIRAGVDRVSLFQMANGGITYWPGQGTASKWATNYAGHFMLEAEKLGYALPPEFIARWVSYQSEQAENWRRDERQSELIQAYRLFLLALADNPSLGAMNRLREGFVSNNVATWMLAAGYHLIGQTEVAKLMVDGLSTNVDNYRELSYTYGSDLRDKAIILSAMGLMKDYSKGKPLADFISSKLNEEKWHSTQTVGFCLLSLAKFFGAIETPLQFSYQLNNNDTESLDIDVPVYKIDLAMEENDKSKISIKNNSGKRIFAKSTLQGIPAIAEETASQNDITMTVTYKDLKGRTIDPAVIDQGSDFYAEVEVYNPGNRGDYQELALTQVFPSGWEVHNTRLINNESSRYDAPTYQDFRDDRVYSYFDLKKRQKKRFGVLINASYRGRFYLPPVQVEAMYDASIQARNKGQWVQVDRK